MPRRKRRTVSERFGTGVLIEVLHEVVVALLALLVQHVLRRVLQAGRQVLVQHLARSESGQGYCRFSERRL